MIAALVLRQEIRAFRVDAEGPALPLAAALEQGLSAAGTVLRRGDLPGHEAAFLPALAGVEGVALAGGALEDASAAAGAAAGHFDHQGLGEGAFGIVGTGQETAEAPGLDDHVGAAHVALLVGDLVGHLDALALHGGLGIGELLVEIPVEIGQNVLPPALAGFDVIQIFFHAGGELEIHDVGETILHQLRDHLAQGRGAEIFAVLDDIFLGGDGGDGGRVGGGAADAVFLHGADQRGLRIAGRGLGELLLRAHFLQINGLALFHVGQGPARILAVLVPGFLIDGGVAGKFHL